ncbi:uncharacterized protein LOC119676161 [Teleopsis dalmanni]|uniref:uncharacterized protein LOC119676161 n=1 Tax=Teleopsis dalmanni TaxID=139649 RepID=UPI0018CDBFF4|nr:uncharacterized protein LOC119676161 [Teleopsis dalmanni]
MKYLHRLLCAIILIQTANFAYSQDEIFFSKNDKDLSINEEKQPINELPKPILINLRNQRDMLAEQEPIEDNVSNREHRSHRPTLMEIALQASVQEGLNAVSQLYHNIEPNIIKNRQLLDDNHPAALLSKFSAPVENTEQREMAAYAMISTTKAFRKK